MAGRLQDQDFKSEAELIAAVQELLKKVEELETKIERLTNGV